MKIGDCFAVESSYGDARPTWKTYRRIRFLGTQSAECYRFEIRPASLSVVGELVLRPYDPIGLDVLCQQTPISAHEWQVALERFLNLVNEPWNCE